MEDDIILLLCTILSHLGEYDMKGVILDAISEQNNMFISDLRDASANLYIIQTLRNTKWQLYDIKECNYALSYIFDRKLTFTDYGEIVDFINSI